MQPPTVLTLTNTAQQEEKQRITQSLAMNYSHRVRNQKRKKKKKKKRMKSPVFQHFTSAQLRIIKKKITAVVIQSSSCVRPPLLLRCNLCWPRASWGLKPASVRSQLPVSRYSCPGRGEEEAGERPPDAHTDAHAH